MNTFSLVLLLLVGLFALMNALAICQAWRMTHFVEAGHPLEDPEEFTFLQRLWVLLTGLRVIRKRNEITPADERLPFRRVFMPLQGDGWIECWSIPRTRARGIVVLFHGYADKKENLIPEAKVFREFGFHCLLVDFPGAGGSSGRTMPIAHRDARDVARRKYPRVPCILFGKSMGATSIIHAVARLGVRADGLVLECPFDSLLNAIKNRLRILNVPPVPFAQLVLFWAEAIERFPGLSFRPAEDARLVRVPTLLFYGAQDRLVTPEQSDHVFRSLAGDKWEVSFPESAHTRYLGDNERRWRVAVREHLDRVCGEGRA